MPPKIPKPGQTTVYVGTPRQVAGHFSLGQGFKALSFDAERRLVNREWAGRSEYIHTINPQAPAQRFTVARGEIQPEYILSDKAKEIIKQRHNNGDFKGRVNETQPPFMASSTKPERYSKVSTGGYTLRRTVLTLQKVVFTLLRLRRHPPTVLWMPGHGLRVLTNHTHWVCHLASGNTRLWLCLPLPVVCGP